MPRDPHDISLAGGGSAALQPREDLWLEGLRQAEVPCEAHRWTDWKPSPTARPCGLAAVSLRQNQSDVGVGAPSV